MRPNQFNFKVHQFLLPKIWGPYMNYNLIFGNREAKSYPYSLENLLLLYISNAFHRKILKYVNKGK